MKKRKVNLDYLNLYQEIPLFCAIEIGAIFNKKSLNKTGKVLIVNTCLIGEFAASVPAMSDFIKRNRGITVDLMVSPPIKSLAEKILGVNKVYIAKSLYGRHNERIGEIEQTFTAYDEIFVMRVSRDAFRVIRKIKTNSLSTGLKQYSGYGIHLWWNVLTRKLPKQWIELNFEMLGGQMREVPFEEMFKFDEGDYADVTRLEAMQTLEKKVIIHTGSGWVMKKWSTSKWVALISRMHALGNMRFIFVGSGEDADDYAEIASRLGFKTYSLIGEIDLLKLLFVLRKSDYFIGIDSGPMNMAHLADTRSLAILGPGPHFFMPWDSRDIALDKSHGRGLYQMFFYKECGFIDKITADEAFEAFKNKIWNS